MSADTDKRNRTCEERITEHMEGRLGAIGDAFEVVDTAWDGGPDPDTRKRFEEYFGHELTGDETEDEESAYTALDELPLGVSARTVFRIELSTGGPADWLEVVCMGDTPRYEAAGAGEHYEVERIVYHFADWFDHAERELSGEELQTAERFASRVVPELIG